MTRADRDRRAIGSPRIAYCPSHAIEVVEIHTQTSTVMSDYRRTLWSTLAPETEVGMKYPGFDAHLVLCDRVCSPI
jgi:hypothetical protein